MARSLSKAVPQQVKEEIGGGDSWLSGVIDGLVGCPEAGAAAPHSSDKAWLQAMQGDDILAALKQQVFGDFSNVEWLASEAALAAHHCS